jgi:hypothetical protein
MRAAMRSESGTALIFIEVEIIGNHFPVLSEQWISRGL